MLKFNINIRQVPINSVMEVELYVLLFDQNCSSVAVFFLTICFDCFTTCVFQMHFNKKTP